MKFQSSFELTGYITAKEIASSNEILRFQSSFELTGYITEALGDSYYNQQLGFKALSSLRVI